MLEGLQNPIHGQHGVFTTSERVRSPPAVGRWDEWGQTPFKDMGGSRTNWIVATQVVLWNGWSCIGLNKAGRCLRHAPTCTSLHSICSIGFAYDFDHVLVRPFRVPLEDLDPQDLADRAVPAMFSAGAPGPTTVCGSASPMLSLCTRPAPTLHRLCSRRVAYDLACTRFAPEWSRHAFGQALLPPHWL